jgi:hypothetical protein
VTRHPIRVIFAAFLVLGSTIGNSPAPIVESPASTPAPARPKPKTAKAQNSKPPSVTPGFAGVWSATVTKRGEQSTSTSQLTLIVQQKTASLTGIVTNTLTSGEYWSNVAEDYNTVPQFSLKYAWASTDLVIEGTTLRIRWPAGQTLDWNPKTVPFSALQAVAVAAPLVTVFTLHGGQLTREFDRPGCPTFYRVKGSPK